MVHLVFIRLEIRVLFVFDWERLRGGSPRELFRVNPGRPMEYSGGQGCPKVYEMMVSTLGFLGERNYL